MVTISVSHFAVCKWKIHLTHAYWSVVPSQLAFKAWLLVDILIYWNTSSLWSRISKANINHNYKLYWKQLAELVKLLSHSWQNTFKLSFSSSFWNCAGWHTVLGVHSGTGCPLGWADTCPGLSLLPLKMKFPVPCCGLVVAAGRTWRPAPEVKPRVSLVLQRSRSGGQWEALWFVILMK